MTNRGAEVEPLVDIQKIPITEPRPIWFVYAGMVELRKGFLKLVKKFLRVFA